MKVVGEERGVEGVEVIFVGWSLESGFLCKSNLAAAWKWLVELEL